MKRPLTIISAAPVMPHRRLKDYPRRELEISCPPELLPFTRGKKACVLTYGCQANVREGEVMSSILAHCGYTLTETLEDADLVLFNTCAIRQMAEERVKGQLGWVKSRKKQAELVTLIGGCMAQEQTNQALFEKELNFIDIIFGINELEKIPELLLKYFQNHQRYLAVSSEISDVKEFTVDDYRSNSFSAFVHVMHGCDRFCSYCIVPFVRGPERSRQKDDILRELHDLKARNYQQVTLVGQNVNAYGKTLNPAVSFATLLSETAQMGFKRVHFITSNVDDFTPEMIAAVETYPNILRHIHLPLQSGDDDILKAMNRHYNVKEFTALYHRLRQIPGMSITTDIIVGFPGETEAQFQATVELCRKLQFDGAFTFIYSPRPNTKAATFPDATPPAEKKARLQRLNEVIAEGAKGRNALLVNTQQSVLVQASHQEESGVIVDGYTHSGKLIHFSAPVLIEPGLVVPVRVTEAKAWTLRGELEIELAIESLVADLNQQLRQDEHVLAYRALAQEISNDPDYQALNAALVASRQAVMKAHAEGVLTDELIAKREELEAAVRNFPAASNLRGLLQTVQAMLQEIEQLLSLKA